MNSFEQLCINFANEQLQQFVNKALVAQEQVSLSSAIIWAIYSHFFPPLEEAKYENDPQYSEEETLNKLDLKGTSFDIPI